MTELKRYSPQAGCIFLRSAIKKAHDTVKGYDKFSLQDTYIMKTLWKVMTSLAVYLQDTYIMKTLWKIWEVRSFL